MSTTLPAFPTLVDPALLAPEEAACPSRWTVRRRARIGLRPVEIGLLQRYGDDVAGRVLELGAQGGGLSAALQYCSSSYLGVVLSAPEQELCRSRFPDAVFRRRRLVELDGLTAGRFDAVIAGHGALDELTDTQARLVFGHLGELLEPGGLLIFSSRRRAWDTHPDGPVAHRAVQLADHDFWLVECVDRRDLPVDPHDCAAERELHFVAVGAGSDG